MLGTDGTAALPNQVFANAGSFAITASYSGDANFNSAVSPAATLTVAAAPALSANPTTVTISQPGEGGSTSLTVSNFSSNSVTFSCAGLPKDATCNFGALSSAGVSSLQINTAGSSASANLSPAARGNGSRRLYALALPGLAALIGLVVPVRRYRRYLQMVALAFLLAAAGALTACGGGSSKAASGDGGTPAGTSTVTVTATVGSQSATLHITLVVQ